MCWKGSACRQILMASQLLQCIMGFVVPWCEYHIEYHCPSLCRRAMNGWHQCCCNESLTTRITEMSALGSVSRKESSACCDTESFSVLTWDHLLWTTLRRASPLLILISPKPKELPFLFNPLSMSAAPRLCLSPSFPLGKGHPNNSRALLWLHPACSLLSH